MVDLTREVVHTSTKHTTVPWDDLYFACEQWLRIRKSRILKNITGVERKSARAILKYLAQTDPNFTAFITLHEELAILLRDEE